MKCAAALAVLLAAGTAVADDEPDEIADTEAKEANLESNDPRRGFTVTFAPGGDVAIGSTVGRGPAVSIRVGQVATRRTVITFELVSTGSLHKAALMSDTVNDASNGFYVGAQRYASMRSSFWVRTAGGLDVLTKDQALDGSSSSSTHGGIGALVGGGLDLFRLASNVGDFRAGVETLAKVSVTGDGPKLHLGFCLNFSLY